MWKLFSKEETEEFRKWSRDNYKVFTPILAIWHPVCQLGCIIINIESCCDDKEKLEHMSALMRQLLLENDSVRIKYNC